MSDISGTVAVMGAAAATMACQSAYSQAGMTAVAMVATGMSTATAALWRGMFFLQKNEQLRVDGFSGVKVFLGPYDEVIGNKQTLEAATSEDYIFVLDKLSG